jgi:osmoprotectant transport system permease protein
MVKAGYRRDSVLAVGGTSLLADVGQQWLRWSYVTGSSHRILDALRQHVELTAVAVAIGLIISLPLGLAAWRFRRLAAPILGLAGVLYTIPALALFALLVPVTGLTKTTAEIGLVSYTLLILVRNVTAGLDAVPSEIREAARGMGMTPARQLIRVDFPLAVPAIVAGIRIATVTTIGLVTVTALIGQNSLGQLIYSGLNNQDRTPVTVGAGLSVALAVVADLSLVGIQRILTPWARRPRTA